MLEQLIKPASDIIGKFVKDKDLQAKLDHELQTLFHHYPVSSTLLFLLILGNLSLPGTFGFYGELFSILSLADIDFLFAALSV